MICLPGLVDNLVRMAIEEVLEDLDKFGATQAAKRFDTIKVDGGRIRTVLNREKFRSRGKNLRWGYPGAREELFILKNCELVIRSHLWNLYLWAPAVDRSARSREAGWIE